MGNLVKETPYSEVTATLERLDSLGVTREDLTAVRSDPVLAQDWANVLLLRDWQPTLSQQVARQIMDRNFLGVEKAVRHFGVRSTSEQLAVLAEVPYSEDVLREYKDTHLLVADFGLSIMDVKARHEALFYSKDNAWYNNQAFAKERGEVCWRLVRKDIVSDSISKTWEEQQALLSENEEVPQARVMVYAIIGLYKATGERLFENVYARYQDLSSSGGRVLVGGFDSRGLDVGRYWGDDARDDLGLASVRKVSVSQG